MEGQPTSDPEEREALFDEITHLADIGNLSYSEAVQLYLATLRIPNARGDV